MKELKDLILPKIRYVENHGLLRSRYEETSMSMTQIGFSEPKYKLEPKSRQQLKYVESRTYLELELAQVLMSRVRR